MVICVFDTETTSIEKPFCYNVGYVLVDTDSRSVLLKRDYVVEQCWHNLPLFSTSYYAEKRPLYIAAMRGRKTVMEKWGNIMRQMRQDFKEWNVVAAYAYNSPFDDGVFTFNNDWYKTINPFDNMPIYDIRGLVSEFISTTQDYKEFCEQHERFTPKGHYSATAETVYQYLTENTDFIEAHTALADSEIEAEILLACLDMGGELMKEYKVIQYMPRYPEKPLTIKVDNQVVYSGTYRKVITRLGVYNFKTTL